MKRFVFIFLSLLLLILIPGCLLVPAPSPNPTPPLGTPPVIREFSGNPSTINSGGTSTLLWNVTGANSVSVDQGIGQVDVAGTRVVSPNASTTYTLTASNSTGSVTASATILVTGTGLPWISSFTANPSTINTGGSSNLQWNITGATSASINQSIGSVSSSGTRTVNPTVTTTYILTATNNLGSVTSTVVVTVGGAPVINSFTASPTTITAGNQSTLIWSITGAISASISPGSINVNAASGSQQVSPGTTTTYTLTATNASGSSTSQVTVTTVGVAGQPVINSFTANPITINAGQTSTLTWNITNATSASINQSINTVNATSGTHTVTPAATITYTLTATNSVGSVTATATVTVSGTSVPVITNFTANPTIVISGSSSVLSWSVTGATTVSIDQGIGTVVSTSGTQQVTNITATTTYTLTASNSNGSVTAQITVTIGTGSLPVIVSFTANPPIISSGQYCHLAYIIQGDPTSVTIDQGVGPASQFGVDVGPLAATTTYTLTATNSAGSVTRTVTVTVQ